MRRAIGVALVLAGVTAVPVRAADACVAPRCVDLTVPVPDGLKVPDNRVRVILPEDYDEDRAAGYPVLYFLHGAGDSYRWQAFEAELPDILELTRALDLIVVRPDAGGDTATSAPGWYTDWRDGSRQWESYHIGVVVPYIDEVLNTAGAAHRAVAGLSMGGYGAVKYAARHPGLFRVAATFSGVVDLRFGGIGGVGHQLALGAEPIWGNAVTEDANWRAHNPTDLAANLRGTEVLIATGDGTVTGAHWGIDCLNPLVVIWCHSVETILWQENLSFARALDAAGVHHRDMFYPGDHYWAYWRDDLAWALPQILAVIG